MTRQDKLEILMLLSAMESWSFATKHEFPDYLYGRLAKIMEQIKAEVLNGLIE